MVKMSVEIDDEALRQELLSFGETVGKITAKTRPLYIKKLNHLRARQTMAEKSEALEKRMATGRRTRGSKLTTPQESVANYQLDFEDDSDSEMNGFEEKTRATQKTRRRTVQGINLPEVSAEVSPARSGRRSVAGSMLKPSQLRDVENDVGLPQKTPPRPSVARIPPRAQTPGSNHHLVDARKADKNASSLMDYSDSERTEDELKDTASVGINTSAWMDNSMSSIFGNKSFSDSMIGKKDDRLTLTPGRSYQPSSFQRGSQADQWRGQSLRLEVHSSSKWQFVSRLLVICALIFFFGLVSLYLFVRLGVIPSIDFASDKKLLLCTEANGPDCLNSEQQDILVTLVDILASRAGDYDCGNESVNRSMMKKEVLGLLKLYPNFSEDTLDDFDSVLAKISAFPQLKIRLLGEDFQTVDNSDLAVHLESTEGKMPFLCRLRKSFVQVVVALLAVVASTVAVICLSMGVKHKLRRRKEEKKEVHQLVQDIVSLLQNHAIECQSDPDLVPYQSIAHVRDALIPLAQRKQKRYLWNRAVELISTCESRVREELQLIGDKQESVWRYLDIPTDPFKKSDQKPKPWSDADVKAVSACLKISNILDGSEDHRKEVVDGPIRDAVFDRCGAYHGILHFDIYENCVYIKLVSEAAAGQAFKYLHGWYYRGNLISVRYVTPLLYRTLFPESTNAMVPLRSSTHRRRSAVPSGSEPVKTSY